MHSVLQAIALYAEETLSAIDDPPTPKEQIELLEGAVERIAIAAAADSVAPLEEDPR